MKIQIITLLLLISALSVHAQNLQNKVIYSTEQLPNGQIYMYDGTDTDVLLKLNGQIPVISDDGRHMLYMRNTTPQDYAHFGELMRYDVIPDTERVLFNNNDYLVGYDFINDDSSLIISYSCNIYHNDFNNGPTGTLGQNCFDDGPDVRQSDGLVVFHNTTQSLFTVNTDGTNRQAVPNTTPADTWPLWSPDGNWILFGRTSTLSVPGRTHNYYKIKANGDSLTQLTFTSAEDSSTYTSNAIWINNGTAILAGGHQPIGYGLKAIQADGTGEHVFVQVAAQEEINFLTGTGQFDIITGLNNALEIEFQLFPNPANNYITVNYPGNKNAGLKISDLTGRTIHTEALSGTNDSVIRSDGISPGIYLVQIIEGNKISGSKKLVITH